MHIVFNGSIKSKGVVFIIKFFIKSSPLRYVILSRICSSRLASEGHIWALLCISSHINYFFQWKIHRVWNKTLDWRQSVTKCNFTNNFVGYTWLQILANWRIFRGGKLSCWQIRIRYLENWNSKLFMKTSGFNCNTLHKYYLIQFQ